MMKLASEHCTGTKISRHWAKHRNPSAVSDQS